MKVKVVKGGKCGCCLWHSERRYVFGLVGEEDALCAECMLEVIGEVEGDEG